MEDFPINSRLLEFRKYLHLSRSEFGKKLGVSQDVIKNLDYNLTTPKDPFISLVCQIYNVDEVWLRTGEGNMITPTPKEDRFLAMIGNYAGDNVDPVKKSIILHIMRLMDEMPDDYVCKLKDIIIELADDLKDN